MRPCSSSNSRKPTRAQSSVQQSQKYYSACSIPTYSICSAIPTASGVLVLLLSASIVNRLFGRLNRVVSTQPKLLTGTMVQWLECFNKQIPLSCIGFRTVCFLLGCDHPLLTSWSMVSLRRREVTQRKFSRNRFQRWRFIRVRKDS